ncbi:MAG: TetR/AcrR family transcriptional regulator [Proteobacteria bacterium]|nr:TetR/AcrR family transcriptional regulator [Pseudomonadota bacterium]MBU1696029.1 TetR/AcrR family transcriptional regulator [Pseudomonadota bacterium]
MKKISKFEIYECYFYQNATRAGVSDSLIYQYFKGKSDLLFAISG